MASNTAQPRGWDPNARVPGETDVAFLQRILMRDVHLGETACTDQDEAEERDVVHYELC